MKKIEVGEYYARLFVETKDKNEAAKQIVDALNSLSNSEKEPISYQTKLDILNIIGEYLSKKRTFKYQDGGEFLIVEEQDNKKFLDMVTSITSQLNS